MASAMECKNDMATCSPIDTGLTRACSANVPRDIPIIFSAPMVQALLSGRKTMTRRLASSPLRNAKVGDRLWVRENWYLRCVASDITEVVYKASCGEGYTACVEQVPTSTATGAHRWIRKNGIHPSIHMPRWASRLTLVVTGSKGERLQDISEADAIAEGIDQKRICGFGDVWMHYANPTGPVGWSDPRQSFQSLWERLHGPESWAANPEVVAISFEVVKANIDAPPTTTRKSPDRSGFIEGGRV